MPSQPSMEGIDMIIGYIEQFFKVAVLKEVKEQSSREKLQSEWIYFKTLLPNAATDPQRIQMYFDILSQASKSQGITKIVSNNIGLREETNNSSRATSSINKNEEQPSNAPDAAEALEIIQRTYENASQEKLQQQPAQLFTAEATKLDRNYPSSLAFAQDSSKIPKEYELLEQKQINLSKTNPQKQQSSNPPDTVEPFSFQRDKIKQNLGSILNLFKDNNSKIFNLKDTADKLVDTENNNYNSLQRHMVSSKNAFSNTIDSNNLKQTVGVPILGVTDNNNNRSLNITPFLQSDTNSYQLSSFSSTGNTTTNTHSYQKRHSLAAPTSYFSYNSSNSTSQNIPSSFPSYLNVPALHRNNSSSNMLTPIPPYVAATSRQNNELDQQTWNQFRNDNAGKVKNNDSYSIAGINSLPMNNFLEAKQQK